MKSPTAIAQIFSPFNNRRHHMNKVKFILLAAFFAFPLSVFSQGLQLNTEEMLMQKWRDFESECALISKMVPCAVGVAEVDKLPAAADKSERDARVKLALSVKAFVSYKALDTSWIEDRVSKELSEVSGRVKIEELALANSQVLKKEYAKITEDGETFHRVITLIALNYQYYKEAEAEIKEAEAESSSSAASDVAATQTSKLDVLLAKTGFKEKAKKIATKTAWFLLGIARKAIGL
jgi:hypothetical protein